MTPFHLKIVTPDGLIYDGQAEELLVRTTNGDVGILARHMNYVAPLGMGRAVIVSDGQRRTAACIGGMVSVSKGEVTLVPTTFEWADKIDVARAEAARERQRRFSTIKTLPTPTCVWPKPSFTAHWSERALPPTYKRSPRYPNGYRGRFRMRAATTQTHAAAPGKEWPRRKKVSNPNGNTEN